MELESTLLGAKTDERTRGQRVRLLRLLAQLYLNVGDNKKAEGAFRELKTVVSSPSEIAELNLQLGVNQRDLLIEQGHFAEAERVHEALRNLPSARSPGRGPFARISDSLSESDVYFRMNDYAKAATAFREGLQQFREYYRANFATMTEAERNQIAIRLKMQSAEFLSFSIVYRSEHPEVQEQAYEMLLWQKTLVSDTLRADRQTLTGEPADRRRTLPTVEALRAALPLEDAAVETVAFLQRDVAGSLNRTLYCALVMLPGRSHTITLVELGDGPALAYDAERMRAAMAVYASGPPKSGEDPRTDYQSTAWTRLEPVLQGARHIYLATAGVLDATAFFAWKNSDGRYLLDHAEIDLRPVFSTADLLASQPASATRDALLIGNADFDGAQGSRALPLNRASAELAPEPAEFRSAIGGHLASLAQTHVELAAIHDELVAHHYQVRAPLEELNATAEALLQARHPAVLHIATHGFFLPADDIDENTPLGLSQVARRSGLFFAGANQALLSTVRSENSRRGVVTAFEVAGMDLHGTKLVVMSACDTGLGQHGESGEALGLRRSFHIAGAQSVLASLWEVDDDATAQLMQAFYRNWLNGKDEYSALRLAAMQVRQTYPQPYFWAPFVLYGP